MIRVTGLILLQGAFELADLSFELQTGDYAVLMGRTGCGKTSLIEALCGLRPVAAGSIEIDGRDVTRAAPGARGIGYVPQDGALFPTLRVSEQLDFALRVRRWSRADRRLRVSELAETLGLESLLERRPEGLSGGERQRVALGRALAARPAVLCLDEPLAALDDETRADMIRAIEAVRSAAPLTALHVTHHADEARRLGTRVLRLEDGRIAGDDAGEISASDRA